MNLFFILARDTKLLTELYESQKLKFSKKFVKRLRFNQRIQVIEKFGEKNCLLSQKFNRGSEK